MMSPLTLPMLKLPRQKHKSANCYEIIEPCHVGIHWIALTEYSQMSTHLPGFRSFSGVLCHFVLATETQSHGTHLRVLSESYPMNTNMTGFRWFAKIIVSSYLHTCFGQKYPQHWKG